MASCFHCGDDDHYARDCPRRQGAVKASPRAPRAPGAVETTWCSNCDERTRLIDLGYAMSRCPECHPFRFQSLPQSRKCPTCNTTVYEWDHAPCGCHSQPGMPLPRPQTKGRPDSTRPEQDGTDQ